MSDSSEIDNALVAKLGSDLVLLSLMPNGVYMDESPPGSTRFVIVSLLFAADEPVFGGRGYEDALYLVKAVALSTVGADMKAAAARIDVLLEDGDLVVPGYSHMAMFREERIRHTERDERDSSIRWYHRGGHYRVQQAVI
jgi:hypothetical protein